jgi:hypothetical protein
LTIIRNWHRLQSIQNQGVDARASRKSRIRRFDDMHSRMEGLAANGLPRVTETHAVPTFRVGDANRAITRLAQVGF